MLKKRQVLLLVRLQVMKLLELALGPERRAKYHNPK